MKHDKYKWLGSAICLALMLVTVGCSQDDLTGGDGKTDGVKPTSYVTLSLAMPSSTGTRAAGGETGNGLEKGQSYENVIRSAVAFFYQGTGANDTGNPNILAAVSFTFPENDGTDGTSPVDRTYTTQPQEVSLENGTYRVIVVANPGTDWWTWRNLKLDDVRNHIQEQAWTDNDGNYSNFLMSSASDATITINSNPEEAPAETTVEVERMAARIDYRNKEDNFTCGDGSGMVEITGAAIVNDYTAGSYLLKRTADDVNGGTCEYLGDEKADATTGAGQNYVIDPLTSQKSETATTFHLPNGQTINGRAGLFGTYYPGTAQNTDPGYWDELCAEGDVITVSNNGDDEKWRRIGYTLENTTPADASGYDYNTAVVFKAKFTPAEGSVTGTYDYEAGGQTFFKYMGVLYATVEDMMDIFYQKEDVITTYFDTEIDACKTYGDVGKFVAELEETSPVDPSGYVTYLKDIVDGKASTETIAESDLTWSTYMKEKCGYVNDNGTVRLNQAGKIVTRNALKPYGVNTYENAVCYYTWLVKHANDGNDNVTGKMEYGIVRNNIYKLEVESVSKLGGDIPGEDDEDDNIIIRAKVNDWILLKPETIIM